MAQVDLRNSAAAQQILDMTHDFDLGNEGHTDLDSLTLDTTSGVISGELTIVAKHTWGTVNVPDPRADDPFHTSEVELAAEKSFPTTFTYDPTANKITGKITVVDITLHVDIAGFHKEYPLVVEKLDLNKIQRALEGDMTALLEMVPNPIGGLVKTVPRDEYARIKSSYEEKYGAANVYFASKDFVDWASPETLARFIGEWIVTEGTATAEILNEVQDHALQELDKVIGWLGTKVQNEAEQMAAQILTGQRVTWPQYDLKVVWQTVKYESQRVATLDNVPLTPWIPSRHGAFVLVWVSHPVVSPAAPSLPNTTDPPGSPAVGMYVVARFKNLTQEPVQLGFKWGPAFAWEPDRMLPHQGITTYVAGTNSLFLADLGARFIAHPETGGTAVVEEVSDAQVPSFDTPNRNSSPRAHIAFVKDQHGNLIWRIAHTV
jgi:hypothetical protein